MNSLDLVNYYVTNKNEFMGENGHEKLLVGLKKYITNINDTNCNLENCNPLCSPLITVLQRIQHK